MAGAGWDLFSLRYDVGEPLSTVFTATSMAGYLRIFKCAAVTRVPLPPAPGPPPTTLAQSPAQGVSCPPGSAHITLG